ncbi:META domain-containing protein [Octadecabacter sp. G9-8]|uniref:META domain-containing protein n=1 Tax=Octadecabacter dasysiphoniae TaxID=2909341 RepID=A0ABS9CX59_9RHOB|nr:META domain-containing protein [Octadecabacter dasysiphoniae]MCF2871838.1 META domain-containing protein [Octadecabacter dasysiphoniae]
MFKIIPFLIMATALSACARDESISKFVDPLSEFHLIEMNGIPFTAAATIAFPEEGRVVGRAPCNSYFATQTVPYPWFALEGIGATRMACPDLALETAFFNALEGMTLSEASGTTLILSNSVGQKMVFAAR